MDLSSIRGQGLIATSLQSLPATILYPAKDSPWQRIVAAHLPLLSTAGTEQEIPKESIIANTDFTMTSVIAKRRLSSKKRKKLSQDSSSSDDTKPTQSPSITSTQQISDEHANQLVGGCTTTTSIIGPSPVVTIAGATPLNNQSHFPNQLPHQLMEEQQCQPKRRIITNNVLPSTTHQVPLISSKPVTSQTAAVTAMKSTSTMMMTNHGVSQQQSNDAKVSEFKWCSAHVFIAERIQQHQHQLQIQKNLHQQHVSNAQHGNTATMNRHQSIEMAHHVHQQQLFHQQQQQQMALLQLYGCYPNNATLVTLQETPHLQLHHGGGAIPLIPHQQPQFVGIQVPGLYSGGALPIALAPADMGNAAFLHSQGGGASWVTPTTVPVIGSCVINPLQPGFLATTSWVK